MKYENILISSLFPTCSILFGVLCIKLSCILRLIKRRPGPPDKYAHATITKVGPIHPIWLNQSIKSNQIKSHQIKSTHPSQNWHPFLLLLLSTRASCFCLLGHIWKPLVQFIANLSGKFYSRTPLCSLNLVEVLNL